MLKGAENVLAKHPEIKLVANQAADWDANKARNVIATVIQQNPDLCGVVGFWDVMDLGAAAAIKESGKSIALVTSGGFTGPRRHARTWRVRRGTRRGWPCHRYRRWAEVIAL